MKDDTRCTDCRLCRPTGFLFSDYERPAYRGASFFDPIRIGICRDGGNLIHLESWRGVNGDRHDVLGCCCAVTDDPETWESPGGTDKRLGIWDYGKSEWKVKREPVIGGYELIGPG